MLRELLEESHDSARVNNLVARAKSQVEEGGDRDAGLEKALVEYVARVVQSTQGVADCVEAPLRSDDVDVFSVISHLTDEGNVLKTEHSQVFLRNQIGAEDGLSLEVESALAKHSSDEGVVLEERLDLLEDLIFGVGGRANQNHVSITDHFGSVCGSLSNRCSKVSVLFVGRALGVASDVLLPQVGSPGKHFDLEMGVEVADGGGASVGEVSTSADCDFEVRLH